MVFLMTTKNHNLSQAKIAKNDEFYTQYHDIDKEIRSYLQYNPDLFKDKVVLLPCDDPTWSNFTKFFIDCFNELGLKKLISTCCAQDDDSLNGKGKVLILCRNSNDSDAKNAFQWDYLQGNGDFRSDEVSALRDAADIIITNPPFSLFREFLVWIVEANKQFAMVANKNCVTYKEVFPLLKNNKLWSGREEWGGGMWFETKNEDDVDKIIDNVNYKNVPSIWITNIEHGRRHQPLDLDTMDNNLRFNSQIKNNSKSYQKYDNYDAIEVPRTDGIPSDYEGVMGVPISFLDKYCPEQFEILGCSYSYGKPDGWDDDVNMNVSINGKPIYKRLLIQHKNQTPTKKEINNAN